MRRYAAAPESPIVAARSPNCRRKPSRPASRCSRCQTNRSITTARERTHALGRKGIAVNAPATQLTMNVGAFSIDILVQGFPGKTVCHGGLGRGTGALGGGGRKSILIDSAP